MRKSSRARIARLHACNASQSLDRNTQRHVVSVLNERISLNAITLIENLCHELAALKAEQRKRDSESPDGVCG